MHERLTERASPSPGRHQPEADGLRLATNSPQGLFVSGLSPKAGEIPLGDRSRYAASEGQT